jgi:hypothetical protein
VSSDEGRQTREPGPSPNRWRAFRRWLIGTGLVVLLPLLLTVPQTIDSSWGIIDRIWPPEPVPSPAIGSATTSPRPSVTSPAEDPSRSANPDAMCVSVGKDAGYVQPTPVRSDDLAFCPVLINGGRLPITGPFTLAGQVLGRPKAGETLVLFVRIDPLTCDTFGKRGAPGKFLLRNLSFDESDGRWAHSDDLGGYDAGVTFGRILEFATASPEVIETLKNSFGQWNESGLDSRELKGVSFKATFRVPPGEADNSRPCAV